jgi:hypothetical protein
MRGAVLIKQAPISRKTTDDRNLITTTFEVGDCSRVNPGRKCHLEVCSYYYYWRIVDSPSKKAKPTAEINCNVQDSLYYTDESRTLSLDPPHPTASQNREGESVATVASRRTYSAPTKATKPTNTDALAKSLFLQPQLLYGCPF